MCEVPGEVCCYKLAVNMKRQRLVVEIESEMVPLSTHSVISVISLGVIVLQILCVSILLQSQPPSVATQAPNAAARNRTVLHNLAL